MLCSSRIVQTITRSNAFSDLFVTIIHLCGNIEWGSNIWKSLWFWIRNCQTWLLLTLITICISRMLWDLPSSIIKIGKISIIFLFLIEDIIVMQERNVLCSRFKNDKKLIQLMQMKKRNKVFSYWKVHLFEVGNKILRSGWCQWLKDMNKFKDSKNTTSTIQMYTNWIIETNDPQHFLKIDNGELLSSGEIIYFSVYAWNSGQP